MQIFNSGARRTFGSALVPERCQKDELFSGEDGTKATWINVPKNVISCLPLRRKMFQIANDSRSQMFKFLMPPN